MNKKICMRKNICLLILLLFAVCLTPLAARAAEMDDVPYLDENGDEQTANGVTELTQDNFPVDRTLTTG